MNHYQKCPICEGRGIVPEGFYQSLRRLSKKNAERCRLCSGIGAIYIFEIIWQGTTTQPIIQEPFIVPFDPNPYPGTTWIGDPPGSCSSVSISTDGDLEIRN